MTSTVRPLLIALTGWGAKEDRDATAASGFDLHLVKPVTHRELVLQIQTLMNEPRKQS
jgi:DNA-binding response OmpR family regulator